MTGNIDCNKCLWATRDGSCASWNCEFVPKSVAYKAWKEGVSNPPLSWDDLTRMDGEPVWIEASSGIARWGIIANIENEHGIDFVTRYGYVGRAKSLQGIEWNAYRKERE